MRTAVERSVCVYNVRAGMSCIYTFLGSQLASLPAQCGGVEGEGRKKMSLNHLLNFTLSPRETGGEVTRRRHFKTHAYNKEHFMQAK